MAENNDIPKGVEGIPLGKRTTQSHGGDEAWQLGGRQDDYDASQFNAELAARRAHRKDK